MRDFHIEISDSTKVSGSLLWQPDRIGEVVRVFPDELEEGPGHRMVKVRWPGPMWTYEASFSLRAALQSDK